MTINNGSFFILASTFFDDVGTLMCPEKGIEAFQQTSFYTYISRYYMSHGAPVSTPSAPTKSAYSMDTLVEDTPLVFEVPISIITTHEPFVDLIFSEKINRSQFSYDPEHEHLYFISIDTLFYGLHNLLVQLQNAIDDPYHRHDVQAYDDLCRKIQIMATGINRISSKLDWDDIAATLSNQHIH